MFIYYKRFLYRLIKINFLLSPSVSQILRKSKLFVKSRYSRNRQWSKVIVYFGLWFNLVSVLWVLFYCYKYALVFTYASWGMLVLILYISLVFKRALCLQQVSTWYLKLGRLVLLTR